MLAHNNEGKKKYRVCYGRKGGKNFFFSFSESHIFNEGGVGRAISFFGFWVNRGEKVILVRGMGWNIEKS